MPSAPGGVRYFDGHLQALHMGTGSFDKFATLTSPSRPIDLYLERNRNIVKGVGKESSASPIEQGGPVAAGRDCELAGFTRPRFSLQYPEPVPVTDLLDQLLAEASLLNGFDEFGHATHRANECRILAPSKSLPRPTQSSPA